MIIVLRLELFEGEQTDDLALFTILSAERERHKVRLEPAYRPQGTTAFHRWVARQSLRAQEQISLILEQGLKEPDYSIPGGEPKVIVERRATPAWPDSFVQGPVRLPLDLAKDILMRPLRLLLENGRNDWGFLNKIVPASWKARWERAVGGRWIEPEMAGGITEIPNIVGKHVAEDPPRRLRTWVMFDSDGRINSHRSAQALKALDTCVAWSVSHHLLERRAIENYVPKATLFDWARRRPDRMSRSKKTEHVEAYLAMTPEQRYYYNLKEGFKKDGESEGNLDDDIKSGLAALYPAPLRNPGGPLWDGLHPTVAQDVWGYDPNQNSYTISENAFDGDHQFETERAKIFQSIFGML